LSHRYIANLEAKRDRAIEERNIMESELAQGHLEIEALLLIASEMDTSKEDDHVKIAREAIIDARKGKE
jgi:hypothetical protein